MKTERRQELQTNVLADWLGQYVELLRPYSKQLLIGAVALVVLAAAAAFLMNDQTTRLSAGWNDFFAAAFEENPARLREVAADHAGTTAGLWAQLAQADIELTRGIRLLYTDRDSANAALDRAIASYELLVQTDNSSEELQNSARFGLAQAYECSGNLQQANKYYDQVIASSTGESALLTQARERKEQLADADMKRFYNWFANQKPAPATTPDVGLPPDLPANLGLLPDSPDLPLPLDTISPPMDDSTSDGGTPDDSSAGDSTNTASPAPVADPTEQATEVVEPAESNQPQPEQSSSEP